MADSSVLVEWRTGTGMWCEFYLNFFLTGGGGEGEVRDALVRQGTAPLKIFIVLVAKTFES